MLALNLLFEDVDTVSTVGTLNSVGICNRTNLTAAIDNCKDRHCENPRGSNPKFCRNRKLICSIYTNVQ